MEEEQNKQEYILKELKTENKLLGLAVIGAAILVLVYIGGYATGYHAGAYNTIEEITQNNPYALINIGPSFGLTFNQSELNIPAIKPAQNAST